MTRPIVHDGLGSLERAAHRLRVAMQWSHSVDVNYVEDPPYARIKQRLTRARFAYFERMKRTPACLYVLMES